ncbi:LacI family DNA-binding transcriptional regulator [Stackebrandtia nassauensis]|uniref:Transcriptional regulator, LacI family n=1 Tax=Stackebrandtia nassauensis (strain DSM 44728 / CIP 108903 / NRRL B-16338 / NBRC 102104 / LLR-40K-21) TaxID=446470 RepID=D3Q413_STANL|nr:LacI family DNA-binding transcriptional regulator [Stackebrandtia nassauensis]ADD45898.1 transcriptional regulator, LacI family [Stackebrandtia nassauensis DSM 44728]
MEKRSAPTLDTVAARAGVGRGTVSRVINGSSRVSQEARDAVNRAITELGYVPNHAARSLVTRRTDVIALVISETEDRMWGEPYFADVIRGITRQLSESGLRLMFTLASTAEDRSRLETYLLGKHVDGALLISLHGDDPLPRHLEGSGLPVVLCGAPVGETDVPFVDSDNRGGARQAVEHLASTGRRRIAAITGPQDMSVGIDRLTGYREALRTEGLPEDPALMEPGDFSEAAGVTAMRALLDRVPDLDAVFAASDPMAFGALRVLRERGIRVPEDVAVVGFDDSPRAEHSEPPLTTVRQAAEPMGREMARLIQARIRGENPDPPSTILSTRLIVRESS